MPRTSNYSHNTRLKIVLGLILALLINTLMPATNLAGQTQALNSSALLVSESRNAERSVSQSNEEKSIQAESESIRVLSLATKDLVYDRNSKMLYASIPSSAGQRGNSITQIDPTTGAIGSSVFIGSEPGKLALSDDGKYLYSYLEGAVAIRRFNLATQTSGLQFNVRNSPTTDPYSIFDMAVMPGKPESIAVSGGGLVAIYDDDIRRPATASNYFYSNYVEFSASADTLYGLTAGGGSSSYLQKISVSSGGATSANPVTVAGSGDFRFDNGRLYTPTGQVLDAPSGNLIGTFTDVGSNALVIPDSTVGRVYFLTTSYPGAPTVTLRAYDLNTFVFLGSSTITGITGVVTSFVRWGANGLAFRTGPDQYNSSIVGNQLYLIQTSLIPSSEPVPTPTPTPSPTPSPSPSPVPVSYIGQIALSSNDIVFDSSRQMIYASVPSLAGSIGNSITAIDPAKGAIGTSAFIGSEPTKLALTDDGHYLYAAMDGAATVCRFDMTTQAPGLQFHLGGDIFDGPDYAFDLATLPGSPDSIAVSKRFKGISVYDNGVPRPDSANYHESYNIESSSSGSTLYASTYNLVQRLSVTASGLSVDANFSVAGGGDIRFDNGLVYTVTGKVLDPQTGGLKGTFTFPNNYSSYPQLVLPDSAHGRVFFLMSGSNNTAVLRAYDMNTFLPLGSVDIPNVQGAMSSLIRWGTNGLAFRTNGISNIPGNNATDNSKIFLIQSTLISPNDPLTVPSPTPTPTPSPSPQPALEVTRVPLTTNDIIYDSAGKKIYASIPGSVGSTGNSIEPLDPETATLGASVFIGSEPRRLAISDDARYLYAGIDGAGAVRRFDLATQTPGLQFSLGSDYNGPKKAFDLAVIPGKPESVAVSARTNYGNYFSGLAIYDNDVQRPTVFNTNYDASYIEFSTSADTIYSYDTWNSTSNLEKISVTAQGTALVSKTPAGGVGDFRIANGLVYMPSGHVIDTQSGMLVGRFATGTYYGNLVAPDPANGRVYFLTIDDPFGSSPVCMLKAFDIHTFLLLGSVQIPNVKWIPTRLFRWGTNGLAFRTGPTEGSSSTTENYIYLIRTSLVPSNETIPATLKLGSPTFSINENGGNATITVYRSGNNSVAASVSYATAAGTATAGSDYTETSGTLNFAAGELSKSFTIPIVDDSLYEGDETVNLTLSNASGATLEPPSTAVLTIIENEDKPSLSINDVSVTETNVGTTNADFTVRLTNPTTQIVTVDYITSDGTANAANDYVASSGRVTIQPGNSTATISVPVYGDTNIEQAETFNVILSNAVNVSSISDAQGLATILNDDTVPDLMISQSVAPSPVQVGSNLNYVLTIVNNGPSTAEAVSMQDNLPSAIIFVSCSATGSGVCSGSGQNRSVVYARLAPGESSVVNITATVKGSVSNGTLITNTATIGSVSGDADASNNSATSFVNAVKVPKLQFSVANYSVAEGAGLATILVNRSDDTSGTATVDYYTSNGTANQRTDYTIASGTLSFASGESSKTFDVLITDNAFVDGSRTVNLALSHPTGNGVVLGTQSTAVLTISDNDSAAPTTNPADDAQFFVRQQYADFLNRAPDAGGLGFWTNEITKCGSDAQCIHDRRVAVADAFFFEAEFQQTGAYIYRIYKASIGLNPTYAQFISDRGRVVAGSGLDQSKSAYALYFVHSAEFQQEYATATTADLFVDQMLTVVKNYSGVDLSSQRGMLIALYDGTDNGRAAILRQVADSQALIDAEYNRSFVLMEYFGYMRRDPDPGGFDFWLSQVNKFPLRNVEIQHAMACSFITSAEYQTRFSSLVTHTNRECPQ